MKITPEMESEAAIYAEGTGYTKEDIIAAYRHHQHGEEIDIQTFCERVLKIANGQEPSVTVTDILRRTHMLRFSLLDALPREEEESEGMQHCLLAHSLLSQVEYHLRLAQMKGVR